MGSATKRAIWSDEELVKFDRVMKEYKPAEHGPLKAYLEQALPHFPGREIGSLTQKAKRLAKSATMETADELAPQVDLDNPTMNLHQVYSELRQVRAEMATVSQTLAELKAREEELRNAGSRLLSLIGEQVAGQAS